MHGSLSAGVISLLTSACLIAAATGQKPVPIPDFTKGEKLVQQGKEPIRARMLGPTGLWAEMFSQGMDHGATRLTRQFLITQVEAGSPADGSIKTGDVIIGVDRKPFDSDARKRLAAAIEKAEGADGNLSLHVWRAGKVADLTIKLKSFGVVHSATCPHTCPKCEALIPVLAGQAAKAALPPQKPEKGQANLMFPSPLRVAVCSTIRVFHKRLCHLCIANGSLDNPE